jgi:hypothetical protein
MSGKGNNQKKPGPLTFGPDIGIASVRWAVLGENRIIDLGVRCFDKAETADKGESLNLARHGQASTQTGYRPLVIKGKLTLPLITRGAAQFAPR